jgi:HAD superfamily hydrolase (TIGR01509 family)
MIDDMDYHIQAWYEIVKGIDNKVSWERVKRECYGKNDELLERLLPGRFSEIEKVHLSWEKEKHYQQAFKPRLRLIDGLQNLLQGANENGIKIAIGSAAILFNIDFVLDGLGIRHLIDVVVSADNVKNSKPDPETFLSCADQLGVDPKDCLVFEDAPKGVEAAFNAGMNCVVIKTMHQPEEFTPYTNIIRYIENYNATLLNELL